MHLLSHADELGWCSLGWLSPVLFLSRIVSCCGQAGLDLYVGSLFFLGFLDGLFGLFNAGAGALCKPLLCDSSLDVPWSFFLIDGWMDFRAEPTVVPRVLFEAFVFTFSAEWRCRAQRDNTRVA